MDLISEDKRIRHSLTVRCVSLQTGSFSGNQVVLGDYRSSEVEGDNPEESPPITIESDSSCSQSVASSEEEESHPGDLLNYEGVDSIVTVSKSPAALNHDKRE